MSAERLSNVIGFDDAPFSREHRGPVRVVGTVYADLRLDGVLIGQVLKDGADAAEALAAMVAESRFAQHARLIMLQGITLGGFNVVDVFALHAALALPILVVARKPPDLAAVRTALEHHLCDGAAKWAIIEKLGAMQPAGAVFVQRVGLSLKQANAVIDRFSIHGHIPEPLRTAHLIAGALSRGQSRGNP